MRFIKKKIGNQKNVSNFFEKHRDYWLKDRRTKVQSNEEKKQINCRPGVCERS